MGSPVLVCTSHRGVFFGYADDPTLDPLPLKKARNCIYWPKECKGFVGLAKFGPLQGSRVGPEADMVLKGITCVVDVTPEAVKLWEAAPWSE